MKRAVLLLAAFILCFGQSSCGKDNGSQGSTYTSLFGNGKDKPAQGEESDLGPVVTAGTSALELPYIISNGMILQQQAQATIWGKATPRAEVTVKPSWTDESFSGRVGLDGIWKIAVTTPAGSFTEHSLTITDSQKGSKTVSGILIGEVWLSAGQSNMEHRIGGFGTPGADNYQPIKDVEEELKDAELPWFHYFKSAYQLSDEPMFQTKSASWFACNAAKAPDIQAIAFFFARKLGRDLNVPVGIIGCAYGGSRIEAWMSLNSLQKFPASEWKDINDLGKKPGDKDKQIPAQIYNGMVLPLLPYTTRGILWYQGESNKDNSASYPRLQKEMVRSWLEVRGLEEGSIPFYYVQLASYKTTVSTTPAQWAAFQQAQLEGQDLIPKSGVIPAYDCGGPTVHYPDKRTPAERLVLMAEARIYGITTTCPDAPRFVSMAVSGKEAVVTLSNAEGLHLAAGESKILYGQVAGTNGTWYDADVTIRGDKLVFSSANVSAPAHVSLCYGAWCVGGTIYNSAGLPVFPFRN